MRSTSRRRVPARFAPDPAGRSDLQVHGIVALKRRHELERSRYGRALSRSCERAHAAQPARLPRGFLRVRVRRGHDTTVTSFATRICEDTCTCCPHNFEPTADARDRRLCSTPIALEFDVDKLEGRCKFAAQARNYPDRCASGLPRGARGRSSSRTTSARGYMEALNAVSREAGAGSEPRPPGHNHAHPTPRLRSSAGRAPGFEPGAQRFDSSRKGFDSHGPAAGGQRVRPLSVW